MTDIEAVLKGLSGVAIALMIVVGLFLVLRHIALWYWRVDEQVALLREIRDLLKHQYVAAVRDGDTPPAPVAAPQNEDTASAYWERVRHANEATRALSDRMLKRPSRQEGITRPTPAPSSAPGPSPRAPP